jgi:EAL domain-containing protein (putative c-di-GMP-specific phosphodiesterase class I)
MSLIKRLWIAAACIALVALLTAAGTNLWSAQRYLENELRIKNLDAANALALTVSQSASDSVMAGLLVSAQFDLGHYGRIDFTAPDGSRLVQRERYARPAQAPGWFVRLVSIAPEPGEAVVQSGWKQLGTIHLQSDPSFAYDTLWTSVRVLAALFVAGCVVLGVVGTLFIRGIMRPLNRVVEQAQALVQRRYVEVAPPSTLEFRRIVEALNHHTRKTKELLDGEVQRLDQLKAQYERDPVTGFMVREVFLRHLRAQLQGAETYDHGCLVLVRVDNLAELNHEVGRLQADALLRRLAALSREALAEQDHVLYGRLNSRDLGILLPGRTDLASVELLLHARLRRDESLSLLTLNFAAAVYRTRTAPADLLLVCDQQLSGEQALPPADAAAPRSAEEWGRIIAEAFVAQEWRLVPYPVRGPDQALLFHDGLAQLRSSVAGEALAAGAFWPWIQRQGLAAQLDLEMLRLALDELGETADALCVNVSFPTVCDENALVSFTALLRAQPGRAQRILLDVPESVAFNHFPAFEHFCRLVLPLGCRIGIEHLDHQFGHIGRLHGLGLHYLKVSRALTSELLHDLQAQGILRGLCTVAHALGLQVVGEDIDGASEAALLYELGFDGASGPAAR